MSGLFQSHEFAMQEFLTNLRVIFEPCICSFGSNCIFEYDIAEHAFWPWQLLVESSPILTWRRENASMDVISGPVLNQGDAPCVKLRPNKNFINFPFSAENLLVLQFIAPHINRRSPLPLLPS
jgi:hypothetical protein